ncbi:MAG: hypothetical protein HY854_17235 [Burkholderiales bacterium]|nr:hypothetical protein [Burkholderiales bacterium]
MNRWIQRALATGLVLAACAAGAQAPAIIREAPADVKVGILGVSATPPIVTINGQPDRLSPGARIRDRNNMMVMSGSLAGQDHYSVYRRDSAGLVHEVWLLNAEEYRKVGGVSTGDPNGIVRFLDLLNAIFLARQVQK